jgi:hypothetical protein
MLDIYAIFYTIVTRNISFFFHRHRGFPLGTVLNMFNPKNLLLERVSRNSVFRPEWMKIKN